MEVQISRAFDNWAAKIIQRGGKITTIACTITAGIVFLGTTLGFRLLGPSAEITEQNKRIVVLEKANVQFTRQMSWVIYMQCRAQKKTEPNDRLPPICDEPPTP